VTNFLRFPRARRGLRRRAEDSFAIRSLTQVGRRRALLALDVLATLIVVATFAQLGPPELLFHAVFVVLTIEAFAYGRPSAFSGSLPPRSPWWPTRSFQGSEFAPMRST